MEGRITPEKIEKLNKYEIFCMGTNLAGRHGLGAAKFAYDNLWAQYGKGYGISWKSNEMVGSYAIPTKGLDIEPIPLSWIEYYVNHFIEYTKGYPQLTFLVTEIGCGLANWKPEQIAPLFKEAIELENIHLPKRFWDVLNK